MTMSDREEGEIVEDDFEDISDNSIIVPLYTGKSESRKENLPAISLSSVSGSDAFERKKICQQRPTKRKSKCYRKRRCRHERNANTHSDSDTYLELDPKLQKQLKAAVHVESDVCHKNNLQSRLKAMQKLETGVIDEIIEKSDKDRSDQKASSDEGDDDLIQLRLEALRTAVLNKYEHRKKRKREMLQKDDILITSVNTNSSETDQKNIHLANENQSVKKACLEKGVEEAIEIISNTPPDEDEDVLRALLLASMSKKITKAIDSTKIKSSVKNSSVIKQNGNKTKNIVWPASVGRQILVPLKNCIAQKNSLKLRSIQLKNVKPIIINVDDDSDTDDESVSKNLIENDKDKSKEIECTVERFLKEQRARIEAELGSPIPQLNTPNVIKPVVSNKPIRTSEILEKSSVKLLPKVKQLEYHKLLQKLKNAENKPKIGHVSSIVETKKKLGGTLPKKITAKKILVPTNTTVTKTEKAPDVNSDARALHIALKQMQTRKNGRLQIEDKYVILTPIIKKINETTTERKKYDKEVKRLLEELKEAKKKLHTTHQNFSTYVKELMVKKEGIEKGLVQSSPNAVVKAKKPKQQPTFTSTPKKDISPLSLLETSSIRSTGTPNATVLLGEESRIEKACDEVDDIQISSGDPNDSFKVNSVIPKYISPLDYMKRKDLFDPLAIMCPYDIDGNCRDAECGYEHYSRRK